MYKKGFTLIELLVVIAIVALFSAITFAASGNARAKSRDARRLTDMRTIQKALESYRTAGNQTYPATLALLIPQYLSAPVLDPQDPIKSYKYFAGCGTYHLGAVLEQAHRGLNTDTDSTVLCATPEPGTPVGVTDFRGDNADCTTGTASPERCFDLKP